MGLMGLLRTPYYCTVCDAISYSSFMKWSGKKAMTLNVKVVTLYLSREQIAFQLDLLFVLKLTQILKNVQGPPLQHTVAFGIICGKQCHITLPPEHFL